MKTIYQLVKSGMREIPCWVLYPIEDGKVSDYPWQGMYLTVKEANEEAARSEKELCKCVVKPYVYVPYQRKFPNHEVTVQYSPWREGFDGKFRTMTYTIKSPDGKISKVSGNSEFGISEDDVNVSVIQDWEEWRNELQSVSEPDPMGNLSDYE